MSVAMPDKNKDAHAVIGTLLEAAIRDQDSIKKAVGGLNAAVGAVSTAAQHLPGAVAQQVDRSIAKATAGAADTLVKRFEDANIDAERAATAYQYAAKFSLRCVVLPVLGMVAIGATAMVAISWMLMPNLNELKTLRSEKAQLEQDIAVLEKMGAKSDVTNCLLPGSGNKSRFCARIDPNFEDRWNGYRIIQNK